MQNKINFGVIGPDITTDSANTVPYPIWVTNQADYNAFNYQAGQTPLNYTVAAGGGGAGCGSAAVIRVASCRD